MAELQGTKQELELEIRYLIDSQPAEVAVELLKDRLLNQYETSESRFKTIFEQSSFGNKIIDADLQIIKVNKALTELLGYSTEELLGTVITDIAHPDFIQDWKELQTGLWSANHTSFSIDTCIIKKDKTVLW